MAEFLGLTAVGWPNMMKQWWQKALIAILLFTVVLGSVFILYVLAQRIARQWRARKHITSVPTAVARYLKDFENSTPQLAALREELTEPKSFGVYLGSFDDVPTLSQVSLLKRWDLIVLDPLQAGVLSAVPSHCTSTHRLGRLDIAALVKPGSSTSSPAIIQALETIHQTLKTSWRLENGAPCFTGILLANWKSALPPVVLSALIRYITNTGLEVSLEVSAPEYLTVDECRQIDLSTTKGLVCRNGTILPNGDRRNYYQMAEMRRALRALAKHSSMGGAFVAMWETVADDVKLDHAVVKRSFDWCRYNNALSWIGPEAALTDARLTATDTVHGEPLGALMWLKNESIMKVLNTWDKNDKIRPGACRGSTIYDSLHSFIPNLGDTLSLQAPAQKELQRSVVAVDAYNLPTSSQRLHSNPISVSPRGYDYTGLGCFQLGLDCSVVDFTELVETQCRLRNLNLLDPVKADDLREVTTQLQLLSKVYSIIDNTKESQTVDELLNLLLSPNGQQLNGLKVYTVLHSGLRTSLSTQFWGIYEVDPISRTTSIFVSAKSPDLAGTILHTFMSSRGCPRHQCLLAENMLAQQTGTLTKELAPRIKLDLEQLTPTETILLLQHLGDSEPEDSVDLLRRVRSLCEYQLMDVPTLGQLRELSGEKYLSGLASPEDLIKSRIDWYREQGSDHPNPSAAVDLFQAVHSRIKEVLKYRQGEVLSQLESVLQTLLQEGEIDAGADILALCVFSAFRKLAVDEIYMEILDRNPLPNGNSDQAACFAEMFATGSQCQAYLNVTPNVLGKILAERYNAYYKEHQPPQRDDHATELPTAYASKQVDLDPDPRPLKLPFYYQVTFLGIFAVPALIDIVLLTTIGRGLYLTAFMSQDEKLMATTALMISLFLVGAVGTWISSGGSYYLHSMAFPAMNMYVLSRFIAGVAVCVAGGLLALLVIGIVKSFLLGFVFFAYFFLLSTYLTVLSTLAIYQLPGFMFQSGRVVIMACMPILFISPILTMWVGHDVLVYLCVLTTFVVSLLVGLRQIVAKWSTWYLKIPCVTDTEIVNWYTAKMAAAASEIKLPPGITDVGATPLPRQALLEAVLKEWNRRPWSKRTHDKFVLKLAQGYGATMFLMDWYCKYSRTKMPYAYSPTWNLQCKASIDTLRDMQKGLKLHNAFVHWRHTGAEVSCGILYFVVALLDKWVALISGGSIVGLSAASSEVYRLPVGFGLAYYLIAAVFLDGVAQPLWIMAQKTTPQPITSLDFLRQAAINDAQAKRRLYWKSFIKFLSMHVWGLAVAAALMWSFNNTSEGTIMFFAYVGAYTGLLWYQYNRIFTGPLALKDLLIAAIAGLVTGVTLHQVVPRFAYSSVTSLAVGTWTAAVLSLWTSGVASFGTKVDDYDDFVKVMPVYHSTSALGDHQPLSQTTQADIFDSVLSLPDHLRYRLNPLNHPGVEVMHILKSHAIRIESATLRTAFPEAKQLISKTIDLWERGSIIIDLVPARHLINQEQKMKSICQTTGERLHLFVFIGLEQAGQDWIMNISRNCKIIAEALVQTTAECRLGFSHDHSMLVELLVVDESEDGSSVPEGIKFQLQSSPVECARAVRSGDKLILRHLLLGLDCDIDWDFLPKTVRRFLLRRCCGGSSRLTEEQLAWFQSCFAACESFDIQQHIARCNLGASLVTQVVVLAEALENHNLFNEYDATDSEEWSFERCVDVPLPPSPGNSFESIRDYFIIPLKSVFNGWTLCIKLVVVSLVADPEFQRELHYLLEGKSFLFRWPITVVLNGIWLFCHTLQRILLPIFFFHGRDNVSKIYDNMKGMKTIIKKDRILVEGLGGPSTCFFIPKSNDAAQLYQYSGVHDKRPEGLKDLISINSYSGRLVLQEREEWANGSMVNHFQYEYPDEPRQNSRIPIQRRCIKGKLDGQLVQYDQRGYITSGSAIRDGNIVEFQYWYRKHAKFDDELLRGEYVFAHITIQVTWSVPPPNNPEKLDKWVPNPKVMEATFIQDGNVYVSKWTYDHKFHPIIATTLDGEDVETPPMIQYDWFKVLEKPKNCSFTHENPVFAFGSVKSNFFSRLFGLNVQRFPISTARARTHLWKAWKSGKQFDAVTTRWLDEMVLRRDPILKPYWRARNVGRLSAAQRYIEAHTDTIMARTDIDPEVSSWTPLAYKISDFSSFGQGGDTRINTRTVDSQLRDSDSELHVLAMDTGTWPNEGGGVSACRRDMVNDLETIRWHILAENANDFGVPKFQIEKNVQSLTVLPLWGLDFLTPTHGVFQDYLDSEVQQRSYETRDRDIKRRFLPILRTLVRCSRAIKLTHQHIEEASRALVDLNTYFETSRHWGDVWKSDIVKKEWRRLWLTENMENARPISQWLDAERPTLLHLDNALDMWHRYLFIFSIPVPETIPDIFQASHHFAGASYGVLCKLKKHCTLHVWDHCISWREVTVFLSSAMSFDSPFVCNSLISLSRLTSTLILHHADVVLPCCDYFNPGWEIEIGSQQNTLCHRRTFARKIDPVVNGICNMEKFKPIEKIKTKTPTVVMLSHVRFVKDIKTAVLAADMIVNEWGFKDYQLHIYGDMEKAPTYSVECQEIIASKSLRDNVILKGLGSPSVVLQDAWIFLNSSVSEGLPLAMGEAALTGVPVVCTDVGASFRVVTDIKTGKRFSSVVAPNDALSLARAQINVMALLEEWSPFAGDLAGYTPPRLGLEPSPDEVKRIRERMDVVSEKRRQLGSLGRDNVFSSFSSERYLKEHEQMLWIGKYQSMSWKAKVAASAEKEIRQQRTARPGHSRGSSWVAEQTALLKEKEKSKTRKKHLSGRIEPESWDWDVEKLSVRGPPSIRGSGHWTPVTGSGSGSATPLRTSQFV